MIHSRSVQMVILTASDPARVARYYADVLGYHLADSQREEAILEGYGMQVVVSEGEDGRYVEPPGREEAIIEITVPMERMEGAWDYDRRVVDPTRLGPVLEGSGLFVYVTVDPGGNPVALVTPLPGAEDDGRPDRVTKRLKRPDF